MKNVMSIVGYGALMMGAGYGVYSYMQNKNPKMLKKAKKVMKQSPYTSGNN